MTAVEFLVKELNKEMGLISFVTGTEESYKLAIFSIIKQAKKIEREQIEDAWDSAYTSEGYFNAEHYYNETFKSE